MANIKIMNVNGQTFSVNESTTVRCELTDASNWQHGVLWDDPDMVDWNYVPFYLAKMHVLSADPTTMKVHDKVPIHEFTVNVIMDCTYFQWWHRNKGLGHNNPDARHMFLAKYLEYLAQQSQAVSV